MEHYNNDPATLNMAAVKDRADIFLTNDSNDTTAFKQAAQRALNL